MDQKRVVIGILFTSSDIGVAYYLVNAIATLHFLDDNRKPKIVVFFHEDCEKFLPLVKYEYVEYIKVDIVKSNWVKGYLMSFFSRQNLFYNRICQKYPVDGLFPFNDFPVGISKSAKVVSWIPDFQHKFYPKFFKKLNLFLRETRFKAIIKKSNTLVLSSEDAHAHLRQFYRVPSKLRVAILRFVSMIREHPKTAFELVKERYNLPERFFLVSNQFYGHKNHIAVFKAVKLLLNERKDFQVIFSGKTEDYRNPDFFSSLSEFININGLHACIKILGLIPREDQLSILENSVAVIQPSKFEGWSTIIEDAKTLKHPIICSSIPVHIEQLGKYGVYFEPDDIKTLAKKMNSFLDGTICVAPPPYDYELRAREFAESFVEIFDK